MAKVRVTACRLFVLLAGSVLILASGYLIGKHIHEHDDLTPDQPFNIGEFHEKTSCSIDDVCHSRLNPNVVPHHYDLFLFPNIEKGTFEGNVSIRLEIKEKVSHIRLHSKNLRITKQVLSDAKSLLPASKLLGRAVKENEYWVMETPNGGEIHKGLYLLNLTFSGSLTDGIVGFYRASYKDGNKDKYVVSTKFQPTYARRAFPCFDEPGIKTTFSLRLVKPSDLVAISNMPVAFEMRSHPSLGYTTVTFEKSVPMVTYLLALAIGDFRWIQSKTRRNVPVRIYATSNQIEHAQYASNVTARMLDFYEGYFGQPYPLPKLDVIGIPEFVSGAMEHWGMISFREANLLYQPGVGAATNQQRISTVLAHEISHLWFGDLVTLKWWNDLWLNEGFASYMEYKAVNAINPEWEILDQFVAEDLSPILEVDGRTSSSHPIVQDVENANQITELFDRISYAKGASVIRMLERVMGKESFQRGIISFLKKYAFGNAVTSDLWDSLEEHADNLDISSFMDTWTRQLGYPVLSVERGNDSKWRVTQERFVSDSDNVVDLQPSPFSYRWEVPLRVQWASPNGGVSKEHSMWIHTSPTTEILPTPPNITWIKLDVQSYSYFRTKLPNNLLLKMRPVFKTSYTPAERCRCLDDIFSLAFSNYVSYNVALDFTTVLMDENHYIPWACSQSHLALIGSLLKDDPDIYTLYKKYAIHVLSPIFNGQTWTDSEEDPHLKRLLKPMIFSLSCRFEHQPCLMKTRELFKAWLDNPKSYQVPPALREIVYRYGMQQTGSEEWDKVFQIYKGESDPQESVRLLQALANTKNTVLLKNLLEIAKNESIIRRQDYFTLIKYMTLNPVANSIVWDFYRREYSYLLKRFTTNDRRFGRAIEDITLSFSTEIRLQEVKTFLKDNPDGGAGSRARLSALERVKNNVAWRKRNADTLNWYLKEFNSKTPSHHHHH